MSEIEKQFIFNQGFEQGKEQGYEQGLEEVEEVKVAYEKLLLDTNHDIEMLKNDNANLQAELTALRDRVDGVNLLAEALLRLDVVDKSEVRRLQIQLQVK